MPKGIALSGSVFRRDVTNLIKWAQTKDTGGTIWEPTNIAAAVVKGLEARLEGQLGQRVMWSMAYTYLDGQDKDTKEPLPHQVRHRGDVSLAYQTPWGLTASLLASIAGEQEKPALPAYQVLDLVLTQQVNEGLQVQLKVQNLLDEEYQVIAGYPAPPRTVTLGARHAF